MKSILITTVALAVMALFTSAAQAITITVAEVQNGAAYVQGTDAAPNATITWEGGIVTMANANGDFNFTGVVPGDCLGTVSDGLSTIQAFMLDCSANSMTLQFAPHYPSGQGEPPPPYGTITLTLNSDKTISCAFSYGIGVLH